MVPELRGRHETKTPTSEAGGWCARVVRRFDSVAQLQPAARERVMMMRAPMVPSQSLHNGYVKSGRLVGSSGLSLRRSGSTSPGRTNTKFGSVMSWPEKFSPETTSCARLADADPLPPTRVGSRGRPLGPRRYHFCVIRREHTGSSLGMSPSVESRGVTPFHRRIPRR